MPADRCACRKVTLKGDVLRLVRADGGSHHRDACQPDLLTDFVAATEDLIESERDAGSLCNDPTCACWGCELLYALVRAQGGGRCVICGCTEDHACDGGCSWTNASRCVCDAHTATEIVTAEKRFAEGRKERRR